MLQRFILYIVTSVLLWTLPASAAQLTQQQLTQKLQAIAKTANCTIGVTAIDIETNKKISVNGSKPFFMASTVKIPIALTLLQRVDEHKESLGRKIKLTKENAVPGSGHLYGQLASTQGALTLSLRELMKDMLVYSDNTATDIILKEVEGPRKVSSHIHHLGFSHITIHRSILELLLSCSGISHAHNSSGCQQSKLTHMLNHTTPEKKVMAWKHFQLDPRDTATSDDMARMLVLLYQGKLLSDQGTHLLLDVMGQCQTGCHRLKGRLPADANVAHKTGTWSISKESVIRNPGSKQLYRYVNDVGVVTLPANRGHLAIAFFVKSKAVSDHTREGVIADATRAIYDYFNKTSESR